MALHDICAAPSIHGPSSAIDLIELFTWHIKVKNIRPSAQKTGMCMCAQLISRNDSIFLLAGYDNGSLSIFLIEYVSFNELISIQIFPESIMCLAGQIQDARLKIVCGGAGNQVKMIHFDLDFLEIVGPLQETEVEREGISSIFISEDLIVAGGWDTMLPIFSSTTLASLTSLAGHTDTLNQVQVVQFDRGIQSSLRPSHRYKELIVSAGNDGVIHLWSLPA